MSDTTDTTEFDRAFAELNGEPAPVAAEPATPESADVTPAEPAAAPAAPAEAVNDADALAGKPVAAEPAPAPAEPAEPVAATPAKPAGANLARLAPELKKVLDALPEGQRATLAPVLEQVGTDLHRLRSEQGRGFAAQRLYDEAQARIRELEAKLQSAPSAEKKAEIQQQIDEEQDLIDRDYPHFSEAVNLRIKRELAKVAPPGQVPAAANPEPAAPQSNEPKPDVAVEPLAAEYEALFQAHPDWQSKLKTAAFQEWFGRQPPGVQALIDSPRSQDAIWLLDTFSDAVTKAQRNADQERNTRNRQRLEQHLGVRGQPNRPASVPDDFDAAFNFYAGRR